MATHDQTQQNQEHDEHHHEPMSVLTYVLVLASLMVLAVITVAASYAGFPKPWDKVVALAIAFAKVAIVMYFFMHLNESSSLVWLFAGVGFFWIVIMMLITLGDYFARTSIPGTI